MLLNNKKNIIPTHLRWTLALLGLGFVVTWQLSLTAMPQRELLPLWLHIVAETFSILIDWMIFAIAWHAYGRERPGNVLILACGLLAVGFLDLGHVLSYRGMPDFITPSGREKGINFWLSARLVSALIMLTVSMRDWKPFSNSFAPNILLASLLMFTALIYWLGLWHQAWWPHTYLEGSGLTIFKRGAEFFISLILLFSALLFYRRLKTVSHKSTKFLFCAAVVTIMSEMSFAIYADVADIFNLVGHFYKIIAYMFIYHAVFVESVREPYLKLGEMRETLKFQRMLLSAQSEALMDGILTVDANRDVLYYNKRFIEIWGMPKEIILTGDDDQFLKYALNQVINPEAFISRINYLNENKEETSIDIVHLRNGRIYERYSSPVLNEHNEYLARLWFFHDITERKANESKLIDYQEHLEEEVKERTCQLTAARDEAETANQAKTTFLSNMSHELRTPLNSVIGYSQLLSQDESIKPTHRRNLDIIHRSARHLLNLINTVLEISKIEAGAATLVLEDCNLNQLLIDVRDMLGIKAADKGLQFRLIRTDTPNCIKTDGFKLKQVLINIIDNAIKYTEKGSVTLHVAKLNSFNNETQIEFIVKDTGTGIPESEINRIFLPFVQLDSKITREGSGLGLAISKHYIDMMGGTLSVSSEPMKGSAFSFSLSVNSSSEEAMGNSDTQWGQLLGVAVGKNILVVDDTKDARYLLSAFIKPIGANIIEAQSGNSAKKIVMETSPDMIFMDWRMTDGDGISTVIWIRSQRDLKQPIIVMLTAEAFEERRNHAIKSGVDEFLTKPLSEKNLIKVLAKYFGNRIEPNILGLDDEPRIDSIMAEKIDALPTALVEKLKFSALHLEGKSIQETVLQIKLVDPNLAEHLSVLSESYQFKRLWNLLGIGKGNT